MTNRNYIYVGFVSIALFACIAVLMLWKSNVVNHMSSYSLKGHFQTVNGLLPQAVVKYRGYTVGRVTAIVPTPTQIIVHFYVHSQHSIPQGSSLKIVFEGLVGEKYIEIIPNTESSEWLAPGSVLMGTSSSGLSDFIDIGTNNLLELQKILTSIAVVFGDVSVAEALKDTVHTMQETTQTLNKVINNISVALASDQYQSIIMTLNEVLAKLNTAIDSDDITKTLSNFKDISEDLKKITDDGALESAVFSTLNETKSTFKQSNTFLSTLRNIRFLTNMELGYLPDSYNAMYLININFYLNTSFVAFGISNYLDKDQLLNATIYSHIYKSIWMNYGFMHQNLSMGLSYISPDNRYSSHLFLYDLNNLGVDFKIYYQLFKSFYVTAGFYEINKPSESGYLGLSLDFL
jgi:phospholipid/cholesterol/gamma-HCH transport system substrate-binding protein